MSGIDFQAVYDKKVLPSYIPEINGIKDTSNFDPKYTKEKARDSDSNSDNHLELDDNHLEGFSFYGTSENLKLNEFHLNYSSSKLVTSQSTVFHGEDDSYLVRVNKFDESY